MSTQYSTVVTWDVDIIDVEYIDSTSAPLALRGLVQTAVKVTAGNPVATVGVYMPGAIVQNAADGSVVRNSGSTASPAWTAL